MGVLFRPYQVQGLCYHNQIFFNEMVAFFPVQLQWMLCYNLVTTVMWEHIVPYANKLCSEMRERLQDIVLLLYCSNPVCIESELNSFATDKYIFQKKKAFFAFQCKCMYWNKMWGDYIFRWRLLRDVLKFWYLPLVWYIWKQQPGWKGTPTHLAFSFYFLPHWTHMAHCLETSLQWGEYRLRSAFLCR